MSKIKIGLARALWWSHLALIFFVLIGPFIAPFIAPFKMPLPTRVVTLILLILIPLIKLHWMTNSNHCILTTLQHQLERREPVAHDAGFIAELIQKVFRYEISEKQAARLTDSIMLGLWLISLYNYVSS